MIKKIVIDFETTNSNPILANVLQICALFIEDNKVVDEYYENVIFDKKWEDCLESEKSSLKFNKIESQSDIDKHNLKSKPITKVLDCFLKKVEEFELGLPISGWACASYDGVILLNIMDKYGYDFFKYFDYFHPRDVMCSFRYFWERDFNDKFKLSLSNTHKHLFPNKFEENMYHDAKFDCLAALDIDICLENRIRKLNATRSVAFVLYGEDKNVVLQLRDNKKNIWNPGVWGTFGGSVEDDEDIIGCAKREVKEELNFDSKEPIFICDFYNKKYNHIHYVFVEKITENQKRKLELREGQKMGWFKIDDALKLDFGVGKDNISILKKIKEYLENMNNPLKNV